MYRRIRLLALAVSAALSTASLFGAVVTKVSDDAFAPLRAAGVARKIVLDRLPIYDNKRSTIELEEFQLWAPDAKVIIHGDHGVVLQTLDPPKRRFFRGSVNQDAESFAFFSVDQAGNDVQGLVATRENKFSVATRHRKAADRSRQGDEVLLVTMDDADSIDTTNRTWECAIEKIRAKEGAVAPNVKAASYRQPAPQGISGTQSYAIKVDIETDFELYQNAGGNAAAATALQTYIANLTGAVSTIYNRDLKTNVTLGNVNLYTTSLDPWAAADANSGLDELGTYYNTAPHQRTASAVVFLSGKDTASGIAWEAVIGSSDFSCGAGCFGGPYAWCGSIDIYFGTKGIGTIPDPNGVNNGTLYGMPTSGLSYWPLEEFAHELGHNMGGEHTQCIPLTGTEATTAGRSFVDTCYNNDGTGCFTGVPPGGSCSSGGFCSPAPPEKGTIMSYCHAIFNGFGVPQSRYVFGLPTEVSHHQLDDYMLNAAGSPSPNSFHKNIVTGVGAFTISSITAPATIGAGASGSASITPVTGATYGWTMTNGTITSATNSNSITFTAGSAGTATIRATAYSGSTKVGVTDTKLVTVTAGCAIVMLPVTTSTINVISGSAFSQTITSTGGAAPYTYALTAGTLPTGLVLSSSGVLSGTTSQAGNFGITITSTDSTTTCSATANYTIHVGTCTSGDINGDGIINAADVFYLINNLFAGGPPPPAAVCANPNGLGTTDAADVFYLIKFLFAGGTAPI